MSKLYTLSEWIGKHRVKIAAIGAIVFALSYVGLRYTIFAVLAAYYVGFIIGEIGK